jgi:predicted  nucleic acid-binding Zn-ribbon protein
MPANPNEPPSLLLHFHVCVHCGSAFRREAFEGRALTSGIFPCPKCGLEGPLNVEIRQSIEPEKKSLDSE